MSEWTAATIKDHHDALQRERELRYTQRFEASERFQAERDRRYAEVSAEREKALKIKEQADRDALELARQIQTYKDEQANKLREQINSERGLYATKDDLNALADKFAATFTPVVNYVSSQQGKGVGADSTIKYLAIGLSTLLTVLLIVGALYALAPR
jgi:hypothetical protein